MRYNGNLSTHRARDNETHRLSWSSCRSDIESRWKCRPWWLRTGWSSWRWARLERASYRWSEGRRTWFDGRRGIAERTKTSTSTTRWSRSSCSCRVDRLAVRCCTTPCTPSTEDLQVVRHASARTKKTTPNSKCTNYFFRTRGLNNKR